MADIIINAVNSATTAAAEAQLFNAPSPASLPAVDPQTSQRFSTLVNTPPDVQAVNPAPAPARVTAPTGIAPANLSGPTSTVTDPRTLGDLMLGRMKSVGDDYRKAKTELHAIVESATSSELSLPKLLALQLRMTDVSIQIDLIAKGVAKVDQHLDQLTKLQ